MKNCNNNKGIAGAIIIAIVAIVVIIAAYAAWRVGTPNMTSPTDQSPSGSAAASFVEITAADASEAGLPSASIRVRETSQQLAARRFPSPGTYLILSGPPGGPLGMAVTSGLPDVAGQAESLESAGHENVEKGGVTWNGVQTPAVSSVQGQANARRQDLRVLAATVGEQGIWITITAPFSGESRGPSELSTSQPYAEMLQAVQVEVTPSTN